MNRNLQSRPYTAWQLIKSFWQSEHRFFAYALLIFVVTMSIAIVGMEVVFNYWYNDFYDALQDYDKRSAFDLIVVFVFLAAVFIVLAVYRYYLQLFLAWRWRDWLTNQFLTRWLEKKSYYYLENFDETTDNPDQRIQEDVGLLVTSSLDLSVGLIAAVTTFFAFIYILWTLSGTLTIPLGRYGALHVPGYLVWVSIIYAILGTFFAFRIGFPLVNLNFEQQRKEANFRFALVDLRSHAEHVALYRGENQQRSMLGKLFDILLGNWWNIILRQKKLLWFTAGYNQVSVILPLLVVLPNYFNKVFKLGGLMQALRAFNQIQDALSFLINSYSQIAQWRAVMRRLLTFINHVSDVEEQASRQNNFIRNTQKADKVTLKNVSIYTPQEDKLLEDVNLEFLHGKNYLIKGPSGLGKSTLIRTIAGIWPYGSGEITLPEDKKIMYVPQKSYMPIGTLREALLFPEKIPDTTDETLKQVLRECDLSDLGDRLHDVSMWSEQLSPGELQRVAFARVLIHKPEWLFLDEGTSALDLPHEAHLYKLLKEKLPQCSLISIGHQPSVEIFHEHQVDLTHFVPAKAEV